MTILKSGLITILNNDSPSEGLGTELNQTKNLMKLVYDFAVLGGAVGDIGLLDDQGNAAILPKGAIVTRSFANVLTNVTSGGSATVALKLLTAADLLAATAKASLVTSAPLVEGVCTGTSATMVGPVTATAGTQVKATVGTAALTAGKIQFFLEYVLS